MKFRGLLVAAVLLAAEFWAFARRRPYSMLSGKR